MRGYGMRPWRWAGLLLAVAAVCWPMPLERALACATVAAAALSWDVRSLWLDEDRRRRETERRWAQAAADSYDLWWAKKQAAGAAKEGKSDE